MGREKFGNNEGQYDRAELDFYATNPYDVKEIMNILNYDKNTRILEPCAGNGHISETLKSLGYNVVTNDIIERDVKLDYTMDFLNQKIDEKYDLVVMNPPFKYAKDFISKSLEYSDKVLVIARLDLLETATRKDLNNGHLKSVWVHSKRARFAKNGDDAKFKESTSMSTAWFLYTNDKTEETKLVVI